MKRKIVAIIQARLTSKRFPNKVIKKIGNLTVIEIILERLKKQGIRKDKVFGSPSFIVNNEIFWGEDRMEDAISWS